MSDECDECHEHALDCFCKNNYVCPDPIRSYDAKIIIKRNDVKELCDQCQKFDKIMNGGPVSLDVYVVCDHKTVKSFDPVQNDCEGVLNFKNEK